LVVGASAARPFSQIFTDPIVFKLEHLEHYKKPNVINDLSTKNTGTLDKSLEHYMKSMGYEAQRCDRNWFDYLRYVTISTT
jgi:hypothetical protein